MNFNKNNIAGVVVFYNPDATAINNIKYYINDIAHLYIIDNSDIRVPSELISSDKISYIANHNNLGVASALNQGAKMAIEDGYDWLLTMDQDSRATEHMVENLLNCPGDISDEQIGIIAPCHNANNMESDYTDKLLVMTSGNLLNLRAFKQCGDFEEKLFIDHVDTEYCLRLRKNGYRVLECNRAVLHHSLGYSYNVGVLNSKQRITQHSPLRWYYYLRNGIYVCSCYFRLFPAFTVYFVKQSIKELIKIMFVYENKWHYLRMTVSALVDVIRGNYGKYHAR